MREFRKKQKRLKKLLNSFATFSAIFIFCYIGASPYIIKAFGDNSQIVFGYICDGLVIACMAILFSYNVKYSKCNSVLEWIEYELDDAGYYYLNRNEDSATEFINNTISNLACNKFTISNNVVVNDFELDVRAIDKNTIMYLINVEDLDRNDIIAYIDSVTYDVTVKNVKRKADVIICFVTNKADEKAIALSKMVTTMGRKDQIKISLAIAEVDTKKCYFLGNRKTNMQENIVKYIIGSSLPLDDSLIGKERLKSQDELEENMKSFNSKDFINGKFFIR